MLDPRLKDNRPSAMEQVFPRTDTEEAEKQVLNFLKMGSPSPRVYIRAVDDSWVINYCRSDASFGMPPNSVSLHPSTKADSQLVSIAFTLASFKDEKAALTKKIELTPSDDKRLRELETEIQNYSTEIAYRL